MNASRLYGALLGMTILGTASFAPVPDRALRPAAVTAEETWTIPGAGRTPGQNNTFFVSDLALTNLGSSAANVTINFVGPGGLPAKPVSLAAGATTAYRDILNVLWSASGLVGALSVESDQPLVLRARTYNTAATGTFGVALPVFASKDLLEEGGIGDSIWVQQNPSGSSGFRTNVGVVFPDAAGGQAVVTFYDAAGGLVGTLNFSSASAGFQQQSVASAAPAGLPVGRAQISVSRGHAAGYAVGVDNVTGDTSLYPLEALPAGVQDVVVSGVARLTGRNNTFFRTDARFYNPTPEEATVTASFHATGTANPTPQTATVTVPAGRLIEAVDVLDSVLHLPVGSGGAVRFTSDKPVAILARTSNVDPQGVQPGTFGAQQKPVLLASYLSSADAGAVVTAIRQDASFRTNVGFAAGPDGAAYLLTLKNAQGTVIAVTTGSLGVFGWAQPSIADLFPGTTIPADATLLVQVTSGTIDVYDASLDNASGDLVVTPIAPVPAAIPSSAQIGPSGGSIRSADGRLTLKVPAGALSAPATLSIVPTANTAPNAIGSAYALSPVGVTFARPAQLVLSYSNEDLAGTGAGGLGIASQEGSSWFGIMGGSVDPVARTLRVPVTSTSPGPAPAGGGQVPLRATQTGNVGPYGSPTLSPAEYSVVEGETVQLGLIFVGPSSTQTTASGFVSLFTGVPNNVVAHWSVLGLSNQGSVSSTPSGLLGTYTAPDCVPPQNPVTVYVSVRHDVTFGGTVIRPFRIVDSKIRVIPKRWAVDIFYRLSTPCSVGFVFSVDFCRSHVFSTFVLRDRSVASFTPGPDHSDERTERSAWCVASPCDQPVLTTISQANLTDLTGTLSQINTLNPIFDLTISADLPGEGAQLNFTCDGHPAHLPIIRYAGAHEFRPVSIAYRDLKTFVNFSLNPFLSEEVEVVLRPISCDLIAAPQTSSCN
ncbi:MAG TPA: hypothetical protein VLG15_06345 [Thermoanaerobaculia bacterium]|nr:hypothetical protein [Thermoanaerobaculia bacterium]